MSKLDCVLAIDLGTSGPKVALVGVDGTVLDSDYEPTPLILTPDGGVEQDPEAWWGAVSAASRRMMDRGAVARDSVIGVCTTAQWLGTVAVNDAGEHLMHALIWMDARGAEFMPDVCGGRIVVQGYEPRKITRWIRVSGGAPGPSGKDPVAHILWIRKYRPDVFHDTKVFLEPKDYLNLRLTGRAVSTVDSIAGHWVTDNRDLSQVDYDPKLLLISHLRRSMLPDIVRSIDVIGELQAVAADDLGIPASVPVVGGTPDVQSATLGSGAVDDFAAHLYLGTSSWITCHVPFKRTDLFRRVASVPAAIPDRYVAGNDQETAGGCINWLRDHVLWPRDSLDAQPAPPDALERINELAASAPPGSSGVIFTPWLNGERTPVDDHTVRAAWSNLSLGTSRADQVRAVFEGVAFNSAWLLHAVEHFTKRRLEPIRAIGGGARSELWCGIHADALGRTIEQVEDPQSANVRGAAFLGIVGLQRSTFGELARSVKVTQTFEPEPSTSALYREIAKEFRAMYKQNKGIYKRLNNG